MNARPAPPTVPPPRFRRGPVIAGIAVTTALVLGGWGLWRVLAGGAGDDATPAQLRAQQRRIESLEQQVATLSRSDQISRDANRDLQATVSERDEEIAGLRADVAFYERLVGSTAQRKGLNVHSIEFAPTEAGSWNYRAVLTQNLNRGAISQGQLRFSIEGVRAGKLATLDWGDLNQRDDAPGQDYSFRYFQELGGNVMLPKDFTPQRVRVSLRGASGSVEQNFDWKPAAGGGSR